MNKKIDAFLLCFIFVIFNISTNFTVLASENYTSNDYVMSVPNEENEYFYEDLDTYESFMKYYFHNLKENHGNNYQGSCGYIAVGMLLAYYDTFHDDRIIPESYDEFYAINIGMNTNYDMIDLKSSPGFGDDIIKNPLDYVPTEECPDYANTLSATEYYDIVESRTETELHSYLISLGHENEWYHYDNPKKTYCATTFQNICDLIPYYLTLRYPSDESNQFSGFSTTDFTLSSITKNDSYGNNVKNFIKNQIDLGNPVLVTINWVDSGHVVIAYDYEIINGEIIIYFHLGYGGNKTHVPSSSSDFGGYKAALVIEWNTPHNCSNNYVYEYMENNVLMHTAYCYEHKDIITYDHVCSDTVHDYEIQTYGINTTSARYYHKAICHCKRVIDQSHTTNSSGFCTVCSQHVNHNFTYNYMNNNQHAINCSSCLYAKTAPHVFDAGNLTYCIACEHIVLGGGIGGVGGILAIQSAPLVSINGSCILSNGYVVLVEEDKEAYFNETLQFYPRGQVPQVN